LARRGLLDGWITLDYLVLGIIAIISLQSWKNGVPWYISWGMYILVAFGIDAVIDDAVKKEKCQVCV